MLSKPGAERQLTELDHARLTSLYGRPLPEELGAAHLVPSREIAPDIVTMYSQMDVLFLHSGQRHKLTLCYPRDAEPARGWVSVLSPIGVALLGLRVGDLAHWQVPHGEERCAEVVTILFQPEASGDYTR